MAAVPDMDPNADKSYMLYVPIVVFSVICPILVATRIWSRLRKGGSLGADDYTILVSLLFAMASHGIMIAACKFGFGRHFATLTPYRQQKSLFYFYLCQITYKGTINLTKCSILLLYLRIFNKVKWFRIICWCLVGAVAAYCIGSIAATIFQCNPVRGAFDKSTEPVCIDSAKFWYANAGFSIASDILILFVPMPLVYKLQIPWIQKMALMVVFALGGFVVITSCLRITTIDITAKTNDLTYDLASTMWTIIEPDVAIMCACLPMIRPLIVKFFPRIMPKSTSGNKYGGTSYGPKSYLSSHSQVRGGDTNEWIEIGGKEGGRHTTSVRQPRFNSGSEESILRAQGLQQGAYLHDGRDPSSGIQKTVQYSIEYSSAK